MSEKVRNRQPIHIVVSGERAFITGDVYMWKHIVKAHDFRWDHEKKHWHGHALRADTIRQELQEAGNLVTFNQDNVLAFEPPQQPTNNMPIVPLQLIQNDGKIYIALDLTPSQLQSMLDKFTHALRTGTGTSN